VLSPTSSRGAHDDDGPIGNDGLRCPVASSGGHMRQRDKHSLLGGLVLIIFTATIVTAFRWPVPQTDSTRSIRVIPQDYKISSK
jgi:hypothetical protein